MVFAANIHVLLFRLIGGFSGIEIVILFHCFVDICDLLLLLIVGTSD